MASDFVFPEDPGTGAAGGDNADAANFATLAYALGIADSVVEGLGLSNTTYGTDTDVDAGLAAVTDASADEAQSSATRDQGVAYSVIAAARTGLSLSGSGVDEIWLDVDLSADDTVTVQVGEPASQPKLKLHEIDNDSDEDTAFNTVRTPVSVFASESDVDDLGEGQFVWVSGDDRYYYEDGN
jgi:hypothetical protein